MEKYLNLNFLKVILIFQDLTQKQLHKKKTQENSTRELIKCVLVINNTKIETIDKITNCRLENLENIFQELYSRLIKPFYITFLVAISLLIILKSKSDYLFNANKFKVYFFGFAFIIFLESSSKFVSTNLIQNLLISILPIFLTLSIYIYFLRILKN